MLTRKILVITIPLPALAFALAWISGNATAGWIPFTGALTLGAGLLIGGLYLLKNEKIPAWLAGLTVGAALLRLSAGVLWFVLLPAYGYDNEVNASGYVMADAYVRDRAAGELAASALPLTRAFTHSRAADQYGGLLFLSAGVYRLAGAHLPLLMVTLTAAFSALAAPLGWALARRLFDDDVARWTAWGLALYPEAVLLGSSQMREAFLMSLVAAALYGLALNRRLRERERRVTGLAWLAGAFLLMLPLSPTYALILLAILALLALSLEEWRLVRSRRFWLALAGGLALVLAAVWLGWEQIAPRLSDRPFDTPLEMAGYWLELSARWQARQTEQASGVVQSVFDDLPEAARLPVLLAYGVTRPLLPAQVLAWGNPVWWAVGVWRALGWTLLLIPLALAPVRAWREPRGRSLPWGVIAACWAVILIAAFWGGGDEWDNPRYRVGFAALQVSLAAWVVLSQRAVRDAWVRRAVGFGVALLAWFGFWYARRYSDFDLIFGWTVVDVFKVLGAGAATGVLYAVWDWAGEGYNAPAKSKD
jgi:4-amino-4-deoxy-L-arabinose transferase-like glycosyltransferase